MRAKAMVRQNDEQEPEMMSKEEGELFEESHTHDFPGLKTLIFI